VWGCRCRSTTWTSLPHELNCTTLPTHSRIRTRYASPACASVSKDSSQKHLPPSSIRRTRFPNKLVPHAALAKMARTPGPHDRQLRTAAGAECDQADALALHKSRARHSLPTLLTPLTPPPVAVGYALLPIFLAPRGPALVRPTIDERGVPWRRGVGLPTPAHRGLCAARTGRVVAVVGALGWLEGRERTRSPACSS